MARALTTGEGKVYDSNNLSVRLEVKMKDAGGNWIELTDLEDINWVESCEVSDDIDAPVMAATIQLVPEVYDYRLSPLFAASKINLPGGVLEERIAINREVAIRVAVLPIHGGDPVAADWRLIFHGTADVLDVATMRLQCVDMGGRLQRLWLERAGEPQTSPGGGDRVYANAPYIAAGATTAAETVMQAVLDDWAPTLSITLATPVSPSWSLTEAWSPSDTANVLDVLRGIAHMIGWECRYRYDSTATDPFGTAAAGGFTLQFYEPDRSNTTPDITLAADQYYEITQIEDSLASIKNRVEVMYREDATQDAVIRSVIAEDSASQTAYGKLYMRVPVEATVGIFAEVNADLLAAAILHDVKDATAAMSVESIFRYDVEIYDLIRFSANGRHFDSNQDLAVAGFRHSFAAGKAATQILLRGSVAGHRGNWWLNNTSSTTTESVNGLSTLANGGGHATDTYTPNTPTLTKDVTLNGFDLHVDAVPPGYSVEWHASTSSGFTPSTSTLLAVTAASSFTAQNLTQGTTRYAKAILRSPTGITSAASTQVSGLPGTTIAHLEVQTGFQVTKANTDGMPFALVVARDETNYIKNPSFEVDTTGWTELSPSDDAPTLSRSTAQFIFGAASLLIDSNDATPTVGSGIGAELTDAYRPTAANGETWTCSAWVKLATGTETVRISIAAEKDDGTVLTSGYSDFTVGTDWTRVHVTHTTTDALTTKLQLNVFVAITTGTTTFDLYLDGVQAEKSANPSAYLDGSLGDGYSWSGAAHDSSSSRAGGLRHHGALQEDAPDFIIYDDGEIACGPLTPSSGSASEIGRAGAALRIAGGGTVFPPTPATSDVFFRTDRGVLYYYDGTRWLSVEEYALSIPPYSGLPNTAYSATTAAIQILAAPSAGGGTQIYLTKWVNDVFIGATNDVTNDWTIGLANSAASTITSYRTGNPDLAAGWNRTETTVNSVRTVATDKFYAVDITENAAPSSINVVGGTIHYRLIG